MSLAISALTVDIRDVGDSISEYSRHKNPANSFALVSGSRYGLHDEPHCTSFIGDRSTCKARKLFLWRREELPAKLAQVHSEERMEVMVVPPRLPGRLAAREGGEGRAAGPDRRGRVWRGAGEGGSRLDSRAQLHYSRLLLPGPRNGI